MDTHVTTTTDTVQEITRGVKLPKYALKALIASASTDEARANLTQICFDFHHNTIVATDGHTLLAMESLRKDWPHDTEENVVTVRVADLHPHKTGKEIMMEFESTHVTILSHHPKFGLLSTRVKLGEFVFPPWREVVPKDIDFKAPAPSRRFALNMKYVGRMALVSGNNGVLMTGVLMTGVEDAEGPVVMRYEDKDEELRWTYVVMPMRV